MFSAHWHCRRWSLAKGSTMFHLFLTCGSRNFSHAKKNTCSQPASLTKPIHFTSCLSRRPPASLNAQLWKTRPLSEKPKRTLIQDPIANVSEQCHWRATFSIQEKCATEVTWSNFKSYTKHLLLHNQTLEWSPCPPIVNRLSQQFIVVQSFPYLQMLPANSNPEHTWFYFSILYDIYLNIYIYIIYITICFLFGNNWECEIQNDQSTCQATEGCAHLASIAAATTTKITRISHGYSHGNLIQGSTANKRRRREQRFTLPKTNIAPENGPSQKETIVFQPSIFRCYVSFRGCIFRSTW